MEKVLEFMRQMDEIRSKLAETEESAATEKRDLTDQERTAFSEGMEKIAGIKAKMERHIKLHSLEEEVREFRAVKPIAQSDPNQPEADSKEWRSFGEFLGAVAQAASPGASLDPRLVKPRREARQLGLNEGVPSEGGFLVQTDFVSELLKRTYETGALASRVRKVPISANANGLTMNAIAETSRATGSRWGGVQSYWLHEAGTKLPTDPSFRQIELKLKKLIGLCYATDELLQDTSALESIITQAFSEDFAWMIDNAIYRGTGVGQPLGITGHAATIAAPAEAGQAPTTILYENIVRMWSRMWARSRGNAVWFINQDIEPQLFTMSLAVGVGGVPVYLPAGGASASPYGQLMGRPVIPVEYASTLGTVGDITLADLSQYLMIDKGGVQSASSIHVAFTTDQSAFRFVYRCDGASMWNLPLTPANGTNTLSPFVQLATR